MDTHSESNPQFEVSAPVTITILGGVPNHYSGTVNACSNEWIEVLLSHPLAAGDIVKAEVAGQFSIGEVIYCEVRESQYVAAVGLTYTIAKVELERMVRDWNFRPAALMAPQPMEASLAAA
jgi:hypothetical protein